MLHSPKETGLRTLVRAILNSDEVRSITTRKSKLTPPKLVRKADVTTAVLDMGEADIGGLLHAGTGTQPSFEWDFGDGTQKTTSSPFVSHDYSDALTADGEILQFKVRCRAVLDNVEVERSLTLHSAYAICRQRGTIVPPVKADIYAHKHYGSFFGEMLVTNLEQEPITLTAQAIVPLSENPDAQERPQFRALKTPIELPPDSRTVIGVYPPYRAPATQTLLNLGTAFAQQIPIADSSDAGDRTAHTESTARASSHARASTDLAATATPELSAGLAPALQSKGDVPRDAAGFTVYFAGQSADGTPVRFTHVFEIHMDERNKEPKLPGFEPPLLARKPWPWEEAEGQEYAVAERGTPDRPSGTGSDAAAGAPVRCVGVKRPGFGMRVTAPSRNQGRCADPVNQGGHPGCRERSRTGANGARERGICATGNHGVSGSDPVAGNVRHKRSARAGPGCRR